MADDITVNLSGDNYRLNIDEQSHGQAPSPEEILHFTAEDQIKVIQRAIGAEETGMWDADTNLAFTKWLRVQQAEHIGVESSDGWWGPGSQAALEGNIDESVFNAVKGLYERDNGGLRNLTWRNKYHNAEWEKIEEEVAAEEAAQAHSDAELTAAAIPAGGIGLLAGKSPMDDFNRVGRDYLEKAYDDIDARFAAATDITPSTKPPAAIKGSAAPPPEVRINQAAADVVTEAAPAMKGSAAPPPEVRINQAAADAVTEAVPAMKGSAAPPPEVRINPAAADTVTEAVPAMKGSAAPPPEVRINQAAADVVTEAVPAMKGSAAPPPEVRINQAAADVATEAVPAMKGSAAPPPELRINPAAADVVTEAVPAMKGPAAPPPEVRINQAAADTVTEAAPAMKGSAAPPPEVRINQAAADVATEAVPAMKGSAAPPPEVRINQAAADAVTEAAPAMKGSAAPPPELRINQAAADVATEAVPAMKGSAAPPPEVRINQAAADVATEAVPAMKGSAAPPPELRINPAAADVVTEAVPAMKGPAAPPPEVRINQAAADTVTEAAPAMKGSAAPPPEVRINQAAADVVTEAVPAGQQVSRAAIQSSEDILPAQNLAGEAAEAVSNPRPSMITIPQREASGWGARILEGFKAGAAESDALKILGKGGRGLLRALPAVGAGIAAAEVAYAQDDAGIAASTGLMDEGARAALWAGYGAHIGQGGIDPTLFGGEAATLGLFRAVEEHYGLDPVMAMMTRPALMIDLADQLFDDGVPNLSDEQIEEIREKYSDENMRGVYDGIIERSGLPDSIFDEQAGTEISIEDAVRDPAYMNRLQEAFEGNDMALQGLNEMQFATSAQDTATQWLEKIEEQRLEEQQRHEQEQSGPEQDQPRWQRFSGGNWGLN